MSEGFKVLTHDYRPPVQGGDRVWDGKRKTLGKVRLDTSGAECAGGWNYTERPETALRIAGLWPDGYPSVLLRVRGGNDTVERGDKLRSSTIPTIWATLPAAARRSPTPHTSFASAWSARSLTGPQASTARARTRERVPG